MTGKRVCNLLLHVKQTAGLYSYSWDGADNLGNPLTAGIYCVIIRMGGTNFIRKVELIR
jgi:hypothetical protein